jgi:hypothetical protein
MAPNLPGARINRGTALLALNRPKQALAEFEVAVTLDAKSASAQTNLGTARENLGDFIGAIAAYDAATRLDAAEPMPKWNKALSLLRLERFEEAWPLYEQRWQLPHLAGVEGRPSTAPWLNDRPLAGKTILLWAEQGLGDTIQFSRYALLVAEQARRVVLQVQPPLVGLIRTMGEGIEVVATGEEVRAVNEHCPLLSLPYAFGTNRDTVPFSAAYLQVNAGRLAMWEARIGPRGGARVGLVWSGSSTHAKDANRSIQLQALLAALPQELDYVCLQKEIRDGDRDLIASHGIREFTDKIADFADTAALCGLMDVVISVDTSVAHLGAALGRPTWILLPFVSDWRWGLGSRTTPWYQSARLYRQDSSGEWQNVIAAVARDLRAHVRQSGGHTS